MISVVEEYPNRKSDQFSVLFWEDNVMLGGDAYFPLGQITTDFLNIDAQILTEIDKRVREFSKEMRALFKHKNNNAIISLQEKLNAIWDIIFTLPFYRDLTLDIRSSYNLLPMLHADKQKWIEIFQDNSEGNKMFMEFLDKMEYFAESIRNFRGQIAGMLELYFENLTRRNREAYAQA